MKALITGIDGQDGSYVAELLLAKGYEVHGVVRRSSKPWNNINHLLGDIALHYADLTNETTLVAIVRDLQPDELYNLGGQSDVGVSFQCPAYTLEVNARAPVYLLEAIRRFCPSTRMYQASTSELFGAAPAPQNEDTPFHPLSPYAASKEDAHRHIGVYRGGFDVYACAGILFNHESERRGEQFVTRKVSKAVARIAQGEQDKLTLWTLDTKRDWGYAPDYVKAMWLMLQQPFPPRDYVVGTGVPHSVGVLVEQAFSVAGLDWADYVGVDDNTERPLDPRLLCADARRIYADLGWAPTTPFPEMVSIMVEHDMEMVKVGGGHHG